THHGLVFPFSNVALENPTDGDTPCMVDLVNERRQNHRRTQSVPCVHRGGGTAEVPTLEWPRDAGGIRGLAESSSAAPERVTEDNGCGENCEYGARQARRKYANWRN